jgi:hypothetical protein
MHLDSGIKLDNNIDSPESASENAPAGDPAKNRSSSSYSGTLKEDEELKAIFERTYGEIKRRDILPRNVLREEEKNELIRLMEPASEYLLVDGYNIIFAWDDLKALAQENLDAARGRLIHMLSNYQGYKKMRPDTGI